MGQNVLFDNTFHIEDLQVFDDQTLQNILDSKSFGLSSETLAIALLGASDSLLDRIQHTIPSSLLSRFQQARRQSYSQSQVETARRAVLNNLFWELTYWKTPELYNELTEGEHLHPGIFIQLEPNIRNRIVLDAGAGTGRASFECIRHGASRVYAVEPSPGLLHILQKKLANNADARRIVPLHGSFDELPLKNESVHVALSCSAFTAKPAEGGEKGLAEMRRVTKRGGKIVIIWPRVEDYEWLARHGFQHVTLPVQQEMYVQFRSLESALRCARRFYAGNQQVANYILERGEPRIPFSVLGLNPPRDYCWLTVE